MEMNLLYDSDDYVVVHIPYEDEAGQKDGYEIVDKDRNVGVFLSGPWAEAFSGQITSWQAKMPEQSAVENVLQGYALFAQNPLVVH